MLVEFRPQGIYLPEIDLWLDPREAVENAWLSHGHSDHARGLHGRVWGTADTLHFYRMRWPGGAPELHPTGYGETFEWKGAELTVLPAAHILGAAQLLVRYRGESLVYTGDIKLRAPLCGAETVVSPCDRLIVECTFGLPIYSFLSREQARERIVSFARECLEGGIQPAFYGYPLGRGQEIAHVLCAAGIPVQVHPSISRFIPRYEEAGYTFNGWEPLDVKSSEGRALVVTPPANAAASDAIAEARVAYVSGWAALANARARSGAEELIPYSDHASFAELLELVERSGAGHVDLVHGYTEAFARILRQRGVNAFSPDAAALRDAVEE